MRIKGSAKAVVPQGTAKSTVPNPRIDLSESTVVTAPIVSSPSKPKIFSRSVARLNSGHQSTISTPHRAGPIKIAIVSMGDESSNELRINRVPHMQASNSTAGQIRSGSGSVVLAGAFMLSSPNEVDFRTTSYHPLV